MSRAGLAEWVEERRQALLSRGYRVVTVEERAAWRRSAAIDDAPDTSPERVTGQDYVSAALPLDNLYFPSLIRSGRLLSARDRGGVRGALLGERTFSGKVLKRLDAMRVPCFWSYAQDGLILNHLVFGPLLDDDEAEALEAVVYREAQKVPTVVHRVDRLKFLWPNSWVEIS